MTLREASGIHYEPLLQLNQQATHRKMMDLCRPLKDYFHVDAFFHSRLGHDGDYYHLGSRPDILEDYFYSGQLLTSPCLSRLHHLLTPLIKIWHPVKEEREELKPICQYFLRNKLNSGITITRHHPTFREMFYFGTEQHVENSHDYWANAVNSLYEFISYYCREADTLFQKAHESSFKMQALVGDDFFQEVPGSDRAHFIPDTTDFNRVLFDVIFSEKKVTNREQDVLRALLMGQSAKEIASELNLSHRAVENNIQRIKAKFDCKTTRELVSLFLTSRMADRITR